MDQRPKAPIPSDPITAADITAGLVVHLDPSTLLQHAATPSPAAARVVIGAHFFLCYAADPDRSWWTPLYTKRSKKRIELSRWGRSGHEKFTGERFEYDPEQTWVATPEAIMLAARAGRDRSRIGLRNRVAVDQLPTLAHEAVAAAPTEVDATPVPD